MAGKEQGRMKKCKTCYLINAKPCYECSACASGDDHYKYWPNTQTNADRIRAMSDEELAKYLFNFQVNSVCGWIKAGGQGGKTVPEMLDWLRQPKEDNQ